MKKQKLVIILVILTLIGAGIGVYIAVCIAPKNKGNASQQQEQKTTSSPNFTKSGSGNSSSSSKSNKDSQSKQSTPNQQEKKPGKPQPNQKEQRIDSVRPKHNPAPQPPSSPAVPPKNNQRPAPQPEQPGNSQQPALNPQPNPSPQPQPADQDKKYDIGPPDALEILELINYARSKENLKPLKMYEPLNRTAQWMANDMKENNYFSHYKPGTTIPHGLLKARTVCNAPAENLVQTSPPDLHTSRVAFNAWMQSPPHRQSIMSSTYTLTGFGIAGNKIVEHFC